MGSGFSKMKKQARMMQDQFSQMKDKMETTLVEGSAGNGLVTVTLNGSKELKKIIIKPECTTDVEGLQDLILAAFESAANKLESQNSLPGKMPWM
jgi:DNA-binding YbaB/EbfC family protein